MNSNWSTGDWDGNGDFNSRDLVLAFQDGGYEAGPRGGNVVVPEPDSRMLVATLLLLSMLGIRMGRTSVESHCQTRLKAK